MKQKTKDLLLEFCKFMDNVSEEATNGGHFDMSAFMQHVGDDNHLSEDKEKIVTKNDFMTCGTSACALGWLAISPVGKKLGLKIFAMSDGIGGVDEHFQLKGRNEVAFAAAKKALDINLEVVNFLFGGIESIKTPKEWADRCRLLVALNGDTTHPMLLNGVPTG
jgi:hypothetical protein